MYHYHVIQNKLDALKMPCAPPNPPRNPSNHWSFHCFSSFTFFKIPHRWNHTICSLFSLSLNYVHLSFLYDFLWLNSAFFSLLTIIPLYGCNTVCLFIRLSFQLLLFGLWGIMSEAAINTYQCTYKQCGHFHVGTKFSTHLNKYLGAPSVFHFIALG